MADERSAGSRAIGRTIGALLLAHQILLGASAAVANEVDATGTGCRTLGLENAVEARAGLSSEQRRQLSRGEIVFGPARERKGFVGAVVVEADPEHAWEVLTDFEAWPRFVPHIDEAKVRREAGIVRIDQTMKVLWQRFDYTVVSRVSSETGRLDLDLDPSSPSDFDRLEARFRVVGLPHGRTLMTLCSVLEAGVPVPGWVKTAVARSTVPDSLVAIRREIERRAEAATPAVRVGANTPR